MGVNIEYVGNKPRKMDNVLNTPRVWEGKGDVVEVEDHEAPAYLAHPDIWARAGEQPKADKKQPVKPKKGDKQEPEAPTGDARAAAIANAMAELNPEDPAVLLDGRAGTFRLDVIEAKTGFPVTQEEVSAVLAKLEESEKPQG